MNLTEWITKEDLSIKEFAEEFVSVVKENFGKHNYKCVTDIVNKHLANGVEPSTDKALHKHFVNASFLPNCTRVEVIDQSGRAYVNWKPTNKVQTQMQDDNKTLKVFIT